MFDFRNIYQCHFYTFKLVKLIFLELLFFLHFPVNCSLFIAYRILQEFIIFEKVKEPVNEVHLHADEMKIFIAKIDGGTFILQYYASLLVIRQIAI